MASVVLPEGGGGKQSPIVFINFFRPANNNAVFLTIEGDTYTKAMSGSGSLCAFAPAGTYRVSGMAIGSNYRILDAQNNNAVLATLAYDNYSYHYGIPVTIPQDTFIRLNYSTGGGTSAWGSVTVTRTGDVK